MADGLRAGRDDALKAQLEQVWHRTRVILVGVGQKQVIDLPGLVRGDVGYGRASVSKMPQSNIKERPFSCFSRKQLLPCSP